ncbi:hypothetical protein MMC13_005280 [Lambiella insularis]|nr:hypothetical protein [Lambiella insularis]
MEDYKLRGGTCFQFLKLPRELRDQTYCTLLDMELPTQVPPPVPNDSLRVGDCLPQNHLIQYQKKLPDIGYIACRGLQRSNRQVFGELSEIIARRRTNLFKLDILVNDHLFPIWTFLPTSIRHLRHVEFHLRISDPIDWFKDYETGKGLYSQALLTILSKLLRNGPGFTDDRSTGIEMKLETFTINWFYSADEDLEPKIGGPYLKVLYIMSSIAKSGLLFPSVRWIRFGYPPLVKRQIVQWEVKDYGKASREAQADRWRPYGWIT